MESGVEWHRLDAPDRRRHPGRADVPDHRGLAGVLAVHLGHDRHAEGRDAPARVDPGGVRDVRQPGARHPPRRSVPVGGQGVLRLRPGQLGAVPALGRRAADPGAGAVEAGRAGRARAALRRDAVLRRPDVLREHAARRPAGGRAGRRAARRVGGRAAARTRCTSDGPRTSASTSSTASA